MPTVITALILLPFAGTSLGACLSLFLKHDHIPDAFHHACEGFAGGVMTAASVWSLLLPAIRQAESTADLSFLSVALGFGAGVLSILLTEQAAQAVYRKTNRREQTPSGTALMILAVTLHNIPEGLAVGIACAGLADRTGTAAGAAALSLGIALQNIPEGAIISLPLRAQGANRRKSCGAGVLSGAVEPLAAAVTLFAAAPIIRLMPFFLSFAAGAMVLVTVRELIPEAAASRSPIGSILFSCGFLLMMTMDVLL